MSIRSLAATSVIALVIAPGHRAEAAIQVFTDFGDWVTAVGNVAGSFVTETFNTNAITIPSLSFTSTAGSIGSQRFNDRVVPGGASTTWSFATGATAFGGFWDLNGPGGPGTGIQLTLIDSANVETVVGTEISRTTAGTFFGILSDDVFKSVRLNAGTQSGVAETYTLDNLSFAAAAIPEPATWAMFLIGFAGLGYAAHRRRSTHGA